MDDLKGKKTFEVNYSPTWANITVEIDFDMEFKVGKTETMKTTQAIKEMVEFWSGYLERLSLNKGDYLHTFLKSLAHEVFLIQLEGNWNTEGVIDQFENREGWFNMDGSCGINIIDVEGVELSRQGDYDIIEKV